MRLIDADALKEEMIAGKIVIDEGVLECDSLHDILVYLLEKVDALVVEKIDAQPTVDVVGEIVERFGEASFVVEVDYDFDEYDDDSVECVFLNEAIEIVEGVMNERD